MKEIKPANVQDTCSKCGKQPPDWEIIHDAVAKVRSKFAIGCGIVAALFGALIILAFINAPAEDPFLDNSLGVAFMIFLAGGSLFLAYKMLTTKPARRQVLRCKYCGNTKERVVASENKKQNTDNG